MTELNLFNMNNFDVHLNHKATHAFGDNSQPGTELLKELSGDGCSIVPQVTNGHATKGGQESDVAVAKPSVELTVEEGDKMTSLPCVNGANENEPKEIACDVFQTNGNDTEAIKAGFGVSNDHSFDQLSYISSDERESCYSKGDLRLKSLHSSTSDENDTNLEFGETNLASKMIKNKMHQSTVMEWVDDEHESDIIYKLNVFRKSRQFCDLIIQVGGRELYCHRVIVGAASRAIFDELCDGEQEAGAVARIPLNATHHGCLPDAVEILIDYMYTAKLTVPSNLLTALYRASLQLGIDRVTPVCRRCIMAELDVDECVLIRRLALSVGDDELKQHVDAFIEENFETVSSSIEFLNLPRIKMEVLQNASVVNPPSVTMRDGVLCSTALCWIYDVIQQKGGERIEDLTEQVLRVTAEDLHSASLGNCPVEQIRGCSHDIERRESCAKRIPSSRLSRSTSMDSLTSSDSGDSGLPPSRCKMDGEWKVIASCHTSDHVVALCSVGDGLCTLTIHLANVTNGDLQNGHDSAGSQSNSTASSVSNSCTSSVGSGSQHSHLIQARCGAGVTQLNGKVYAAGGFNQSECLDTVECFDSTANRWSPVSSMNDKRGRFSVAVLRGQLYAVGGSSGSQNQISVERYDPTSDTWSHVQHLLSRCSEAGVAVLSDLLYCVGGIRQSSGVAGMKACQVYDPDVDQWTARSTLHTGRCSLGVAALGGFLFAVGGSDGWSCLSSVERYDPEAASWTASASLNVPRRGLGVVAHNGALYCVGGFDGHSFLTSVERYAPSEGEMWGLVTASLCVPRNNVGVASLNGNLFVVGGFSGRQFLSSVEILADGSGEWCGNDHFSAGVDLQPAQTEAEKE